VEHAQARLPVTPDIVDAEVVLEELDLSPDGRTAVVVRRRVRGLDYVRDLLLVDLDGGPPRRLLVPGTDANHPRWSPDGRHIAYLAAGRSSAPQVHVVAVSRRERARDQRTRHLTREAHGVSGFAWSPDGGRVGFWGWAGPARFVEGLTPRGRRPTVRVIRQASFRWNDVGFLDHRTHLSVVDVGRGARPRRLTHGDFDVQSPEWDADGRSLVFTAAMAPDADLYPMPRVYRIGAVESDDTPALPIEVLALGDGVADAVMPSPDGRWLAISGSDVPGAPDWSWPHVFLARSDGSGTPIRLAPDADLPHGSWLDCDMTGWTSWQRPGPFFSVDASGHADAVIAVLSDRGRSRPWRLAFDPRTGAPGPAAPLAGGDSVCYQAAVANGRVAVVGALGTRAMEVMEAREGVYRTRSRFGSSWQRRYRPTPGRMLTIPGPGGPIETWLHSPPDAGDRALALVIDLHGGPMGAWGPSPWLEMRMLVEAGILVAAPNIRGATGYGSDWLRAQSEAWGEVDDDDVMAVVDHLVDAGLADGERVGLIGLSYGGYLVNWLIGAHPGRFAAAVSDGGVADMRSTWALSDSGPDFHRRAGMAEPTSPAGVERLWQQSPLRLADRIRTPLLILQGEDDHRCPPGDNLQLFTTLRALGREVELALYPGSGHTFSVTGRPDRRKDRHQRMLDWFVRYLRPAGPTAG
jgi:dipeptidyl aminopeptidase/acylaminoacyl peptidase